MERKWHPVKSKSSASDKVEPPNSEWDERGFSQYNFFSSPCFLLLLPLLSFARCLLASVLSELPPFILHLISSWPFSPYHKWKARRKRKKKEGFAFHYKISRSPSNDNGEINFLPHPPGACKRKKNKERHGKDSSTSQHNHHISRKCATAYFRWYFALKIRFFMIHLRQKISLSVSRWKSGFWTNPFPFIRIFPWQHVAVSDSLPSWKPSMLPFISIFMKCR